MVPCRGNPSRPIHRWARQGSPTCQQCALTSAPSDGRIVATHWADGDGRLPPTTVLAFGECLKPWGLPPPLEGGLRLAALGSAQHSFQLQGSLRLSVGPFRVQLHRLVLLFWNRGFRCLSLPFSRFVVSNDHPRLFLWRSYTAKARRGSNEVVVSTESDRRQQAREQARHDPGMIAATFGCRNLLIEARRPRASNGDHSNLQHQAPCGRPPAGLKAARLRAARSGEGVNVRDQRRRSI